MGNIVSMVKASKTDPFRLGVEIFVGKTGNALCPVSAVLAYMAIRGPGPGPLFRFVNGSPLTRAHLVTKVKEAIAAAGIDCTPYSGHSFRSGAATTAARQGIGDATIKTLGRWQSNAYQDPAPPTCSHFPTVGGCQMSMLVTL